MGAAGRAPGEVALQFTLLPPVEPPFTRRIILQLQTLDAFALVKPPPATHRLGVDIEDSGDLASVKTVIQQQKRVGPTRRQIVGLALAQKPLKSKAPGGREPQRIIMIHGPSMNLAKTIPNVTF
jgi:hypothetical protein